MRIGTWNLAGRWTPEHRDFLSAAGCDLWLLTEVSDRVDLPGFHAHLTEHEMAARRRWAGVFSRRPLTPLPDPHPASAAAVVDGVTVCSSILPWKGVGAREPWLDGRHADKTERTVKELLAAFPPGDLVWGGDWNHALSGPEHSGGKCGRAHILDAVEALGLTVPTAALAHRIEGLLSIDHIAVSSSFRVRSAEWLVAEVEGRRLSDHDAYVVTTG